MRESSVMSFKWYRWIILLFGVIAQMIFSYVFTGIPVSGIIIQQSYQFSIFELGIVMGSMGLGVTISEIIWGILTDKLGDKKVLIIGLSLTALTFLFIALYLSPNSNNDNHIYYLWLSLSLVLAGVFGGSINSSSGRAVMAWFEDGERGFAMSIRQTAIPVGGAIGAFLFPLLSMKYGVKASYFSVFIACIIAVIFISFIFVEEKSFLTDKESVNSTSKKDISIFRSRRIWKLALSGAFLTVPQMAVLSFGIIFLSQVYNMSISDSSLLIVLIQLIGGAMRMLLGFLSDRYNNRVQLMMITTVFVTVAAFMLALSVNYLLSVFLLIILGVSSQSWHGIAYTEIAVLSGFKQSGSSLGMMGCTVFLSCFLTPILLSFLIGILQWELVWIIVGVLSFVAFFLLKNSNKFEKKG